MPISISKAIETTQDIINAHASARTPDSLKALALCIEALKRVRWHKDQHLDGYYEPLPGETDWGENEHH